MARLSIAGLILVCCCLNASDTLARPFRVGVAVWSGYPDSVEGFREGVDSVLANREIEYVVRNAGADKATQYAIAREFAEQKLDLVYSLTTPGTSIIKEVLHPDTPIVFSIVTYPADSGLIESMEYSGNNLVGTSNYVPLSNYVELLKKMLPRLFSIGEESLIPRFRHQT